MTASRHTVRSIWCGYMPCLADAVARRCPAELRIGLAADPVVRIRPVACGSGVVTWLAVTGIWIWVEAGFADAVVRLGASELCVGVAGLAFIGKAPDARQA